MVRPWIVTRWLGNTLASPLLPHGSSDLRLDVPALIRNLARSEAEPADDSARPISAVPWRLSLQRQIQLALAVFVVVAALVIGMAYLTVQANEEANARVEHSYQVLSAADRLQQSLLDMETGYRGFLISGDDSFLQPYEQGRTNVATLFASLKSLTAADPTQEARWSALQQQTDSWEGQVIEPRIALRRELQPEIDSGTISARELTLILSDDPGKARFDQIRATYASAVSIERAVRQQRIDVANAANERLRLVLVVGSAILLALVGVLGYLLTRSSRAWERLYHDQAAARQDAEAATRAREEFLSVAAHELRTPITSLWGSAQLGLRRLDRQGSLDPSNVRQILRVVDEQSARLQRLVAQLLDVSRIVDGRLRLEPAPVEISSLVERSLTSLHFAYPERELCLQAAPSVETVVDASRIEQVLVNLIGNAVKFSPADSPIEVEVSRSGDKVRIAVRDHGPGVPPEDRERIFEQFIQAANAAGRGGLGLGLFICREIVTLHGGSLTLENPSDGGACFVVLLPTARM